MIKETVCLRGKNVREARRGQKPKMSSVDTRDIQRDSLFLMADLRLDGGTHELRVKVRNLSAGGMMAEGGLVVTHGAKVAVKLRNIGWVDGIVAWVHEERFGIAFAREVDPMLARAPSQDPEGHSPRFTRPSSLLPPDTRIDKSKFRTI